MKRPIVLTANAAQVELRRFARRRTAQGASTFFKTGPGEYGEGDMFLGVSVPNGRAVAKRFRDLDLVQVATLLKSKFHEDRSLALFILVLKFERADANERKKIYEFYFKNLKYVNNWDLVDASAYQIVGAYTFAHPVKRTVLKRLVRSRNLWERRVAMVAMFHFIKQKRYEEPLAIAGALLGDSEDLIHKAVGWMLRELGKRGDMAVLNAFLDRHAHRMPRTALRYAIERHTPKDRARYMTQVPS